ncbi:MAG: GNAT family N-acetyltransferase [Pseudomonadota bacterium]
MIRVSNANLSNVIRLLETRPELAMFPLDNIARHGLGGHHPRSMRIWVDRLDEPSMVLGLSREGMVMPFRPETLDVDACLAILRGQPLMGLIGQAEPVRAIMAAAGLMGRSGGLDKDEPQFLLDLNALRLPDGQGTLAPISDHADLVTTWRVAYDTELKVRINDVAQAALDVTRWIERDSHRLLMIDGRPAAMTGFNARLPDIVQVGGVYTPPEARGRGLARRAVALHLEEARSQGVRRATLFAASETAVACYRPLGFRRIGDFALVLFNGTVTI